MLRVFIGFDAREAVAYHVLSHSILTRASGPVAITPLVRTSIPGFERPRGLLDSTDFSISRFMVPSLCEYEGRAVYMDCDMLVQCDLYKLLWDMLKHPDAAVHVVKHNYVPKGVIKMDGQGQIAYPRKNWSSFMVFENRRCRVLTPEYVDSAPGLELHRFAWLDDSEIGSLPLEWNWLVGEYPPDATVKVLHYTLGGPWFPEQQNCDHADLWLNEWAKTTGLDEG